MNWITKFIKPKIKSLFEKRSSKSEENLWTTCGCKNLIYKEDLQSNLKCCPKCGVHHKLSCKERFETFFDNNKNLVIGFGITNKTISSLKTADGLVVGSQLCKTISDSIEKRQNPVTKLDKLVYSLKSKIV